VKQTYLTHISHLLGKHEAVAQELPNGIEQGFDGMTFQIDS